MIEKLLNVVANRPYLTFGVLLVVLGAIGSIPLGDKLFKIQEALLQWVVLAIGVLLIIVDFYIHRTTPLPRLDRVAGGINEPANEAVHVPEVITARGWAQNLESGQHLWLVVEWNNRLWPKAGEISVDNRGMWQHTVFEQGAEDTFGLSLYVANADGHKRILEWLDLGPLIEFRPFLHEIPGTRRLHLNKLHKTQ